MAIPFQCPACDLRTELPDLYRGQRVQCSRCAGVFALPEDGIGPPEAVHPEGDLLAGEPTKECPFCGERIKRSARKCRFCGEIVDRELARAKKIEEQKDIERRQRLLAASESRAAMASLSVAVVGVFAAGLFPGLGIPLGALAFVLGVVARVEISRKPHLSGRGLATAGMAIGALGFLGSILMVTVLAANRESIEALGQ
ncbi:MAG: DUF4190 domain-containing protein [Planctomycetes bacterium]|nr:DUF4190 domain-containing protein [Planctomycetota bacterium]